MKVSFIATMSVVTMSFCANLFADTSLIHVAGILVEHDTQERAKAVEVRLVFAGTAHDVNPTNANGLYSLISDTALDDTVPSIGIRVENDSRYDDLTRPVSLSKSVAGTRRGKAPDFELLSRNHPNGNTAKVAAQRLANAQETEYWNVRLKMSTMAEAKLRLARKSGAIWAGFSDDVKSAMFPSVVDESEKYLDPAVLPAIREAFNKQSLMGLPQLEDFGQAFNDEGKRISTLDRRVAEVLSGKERPSDQLLDELLSVPKGQTPFSWKISPGSQRIIKDDLNDQVKDLKTNAENVLMLPKTLVKGDRNTLDSNVIIKVHRGVGVDDDTVSRLLKENADIRHLGVLIQLRNLPSLTDEQRSKIEQKLEAIRPTAVPEQ